MQRRPPYNPATSGPQAAQVHDRRAKEINRGSAAHIIEGEVDDPYEAGAKISIIRSVRGDPLAWHLARGHIDKAQYEAGRMFQRHFGKAERGPRAIQMVEAVDGTPLHDGLTDSQITAWKWLARCYRKLGADGSAVVHDALISAMSTKQIAAARGLAGPEWQKYFMKRLGECLNCLAIVYGYSNGVRAVTAPSSPAQRPKQPVP